MKNSFSFLARAVAIASLAFGFTASAIPVWINEIHYDNIGGDQNELVEIAGVAGTSLVGYSILLYNGSGGAMYGTAIPLSGIIGNQQNGFGTLSFPAVGIQNGDPDGLALVGPGSSVIQFLSYEGTFTAVGGAANGMISVNIGGEPETTPIGRSLQLIGAGNSYEHFRWSSPITATANEVNTGQSFTVPEGGSMFVLLALSMSILFLARRLQVVCVPARRRFHRRPSLHQ